MLHSRGRLLAFHANAGLGWKQLTVTNVLAYFGVDLIEQHVLDTNAEKQLSLAAEDV